MFVKQTVANWNLPTQNPSGQMKRFSVKKEKLKPMSISGHCSFEFTV